MDLVTFKSDPVFFFKERDGVKPNTVRENKSINDERFTALEGLNPPKYIRIVNSGNPRWTFKRKITDISYYNGLWIISWQHDKRNLEEIIKG